MTQTPTNLDAVPTSEEQLLQILGRELVNALFIAARSAFIHDLDNAAVEKPLNSLMQIINGIRRQLGDACEFQVVDESLFLNKTLIQITASQLDSATYLRRLFERPA